MATNIRYTESNKYNKPLTLEDRIKIREIISTNRADDGSMTILLNDSCKRRCNDFKLSRCKHLKKFPSICNGCKKLKTCTLERAFYVPLNANTSYRE